MAMHNPRSFSYAAAAALAIASVSCYSRGYNDYQYYAEGGSYPSSLPLYSSVNGSIIVSSPISGDGDIYTVAADGSRSQLTGTPGMEVSPFWIEPAKKYCYLRISSGSSELMIGDATTGEQSVLRKLDPSSRLIGVSPDSSQAIISSDRPLGGMGKVIDYKLVDLPHGNYGDIKLPGKPSYSPDSRHIACAVLGTVNGVFILRRTGEIITERRGGYSSCFLDDSTSIITTSTEPYSLELSTLGSSKPDMQIATTEVLRIVAWGASACILRGRDSERMYRYDRIAGELKAFEFSACDHGGWACFAGYATILCKFSESRYGTGTAFIYNVDKNAVVLRIRISDLSVEFNGQ